MSEPFDDRAVGSESASRKNQHRASFDGSAKEPSSQPRRTSRRSLLLLVIGMVACHLVGVTMPSAAGAGIAPRSARILAATELSPPCQNS